MFLNDKIIVIDVEATCWDLNNKPNNMEHDIIEIGLCKYIVTTGEIVEKISYYVIPERSQISEFCSNLTGITNEVIAQNGLTFKDVCGKIKKKYGSDIRAWAAYGEYDRTLILNHCSAFGISNPFSDTYINIKSLFTFKNKLSKSLGLINELNFIGEIFEGENHRADNDAYNAAKLLRSILN